MAATRELWFWGDEPNENGQDFLRAFCRTVVEDEQRVEQFVYYLHSGSVADDWYNDLPEDTKKDWNSVKEEFTKRWPIIRRARKTQSQCISELREMKLSEDDLFKKETWGWQRQVYSHVAWACKMEELVRGARLWDTDILLDEIKSRLPRAIKTVVGRVYLWRELVRGVRDLDIDELEGAMNTINAARTESSIRQHSIRDAYWAAGR